LTQKQLDEQPGSGAVGMQLADLGLAAWQQVVPSQRQKVSFARFHFCT
jgi:hypothetical protein